MTREEASTWASQVYTAAEGQGDELVVEALEALIGIDQWQVDADMQPTDYLFDFEELRGLHDRLQDSASDDPAS